MLNTFSFMVYWYSRKPVADSTGTVSVPTHCEDEISDDGRLHKVMVLLSTTK